MSTAVLLQACTTAHSESPGNCSGAVRLIAHKLGYPLPPLSANQLVDYFENKTNGWTPVNEREAQAGADRGALIVAGKKEAPNGHVVVVMPGGFQASGGYAFTNAKSGKTGTAGNHGNFPRSCSTAMGSWPGAVSTGEKSVFDAWGSIKKYGGVKYWAAPLKASFDFGRLIPGKVLTNRVELLKGRTWKFPTFCALSANLPARRPFLVRGVNLVEKWFDVEAKLDVPLTLRVSAEEGAALFSE